MVFEKDNTLAHNIHIEYSKGTVPLIISVPHGGSLMVEGIPDRVEGIYGIDRNTVDIACSLRKKISNLYGINQEKMKVPSYIISKVHRIKIDFNRKTSKAFNKESNLAKMIYHSFHKTLLDLISYNLGKFNRSVLVDIHGFEKKRRPIGFRDVELVLGTNNLKSMFSTVLPKKDWGKNLRGNIIRKFNELDIAIAPGHPRRREYVLTGGYIVNNYGARKIKNSQTIQIEFSDKIRLKDNILKEKVLDVLAQLLYNECTTAK
ncbi:MAG: hypothetical protein KGD72_05820 [Candidatus Lokiarchaeota archaeon]|nr:hypothetical protein [Candidatus Lokiarchaeota archaeon]